MYKDFFGLRELPFSIVPNSRFIFLSGRHREAMNHLQLGLGSGGGFALLTGEVGTGKTTVSKALLSHLDANTQAGLLLNPTYTSNELLEAICDEFSVAYPEDASLKQLTQAISAFLLDNHAKGIQTLVLIDEAQHLSADVLEQLRLLTNLETDSQKLLRVLLVGQPELQQKLQTPELRQLAQRITGRYHLLPLSAEEVGQYIEFRMQIAGGVEQVFSTKALKHITQATQGVPRLINLVCDKCLQYAYYSNSKEVDLTTAQKACKDVMSFQSPVANNPQVTDEAPKRNLSPYLLSLGIGALVAAAAYLYLPDLLAKNNDTDVAQTQAMEKLTEQASELAALEESVDVAQETESVVTSPETTDISEPDDLVPLLPASNASADSSLAQEMQDHLKQSYQRADSLQLLFNLWGYQVEKSQASCQNAQRADLFCFEERGTLSDLKLLNRPAILNFYQEQRASFAVLYQLDEATQSAQLLVAGKRIQVPLDWLTENWSGEFLIFWKNDVSKRTLKQGDNGQDVVRLDQKLSQVLGEAQANTHSFNAAIKRKVEAFQMWQGIKVDGIAGTQTLMLLDSYSNQAAPSLDNPQGEF